MGQHWPELGAGCRVRSWCGMSCSAVPFSALDREGPVSGEESGKGSWDVSLG